MQGVDERSGRRTGGVVRAGAGLWLALGLLAAAPGAVRAQAPAPAQTVLSTSSWLSPSHPVSRTLTRWCDEVARATAARVVCRPRPAPIQPATRSFEAVRRGEVDVAYSVHAYTPAEFRLTRFVELPFGGVSAEAASVAYQRIHERFLAGLDEHRGLKVLAVFTHGPGQLFSTGRPMRDAEELSRLSIRASGGLVSDIAREAGWTVSVLPAAQTPAALASGKIDAVFLPAEAVAGYGLAAQVRRRSPMPGGWYNTSFAVVINEARWRALEARDREAIEALSGEVLARALGRGFDVADRHVLARMQAAGVVVDSPSAALREAWRQQARAFEARWRRDALERGVRDPDDVLRQYRAELRALN